MIVPSFAYEAAGPDGVIGRGVVDAANRALAVERILALGRTPVRVVEQDGDPAAAPAASHLLPVFGLAGERLALLREFASLLGAGLSVERTLVAMQGLAAKPRTRGAVQAILAGVRGGEPLSVAMQRADQLFPESLRRLVVAGEASGQLPAVMTRLAGAQAKNKELQERTVSALIYPALLVTVMIVVLTIIFTVVVPRLEPLFAESGAALPWPAALLLGVSRFLDAYGSVLGLTLAGGFAGLLYTMRQPAARVARDAWALRSPVVFGIPRGSEAAQFCRNLAMLVDGGLPLNRALEAAQASARNAEMRRQLAGTVELVRQGRSLRAAIDATPALPRVVAEFAAVGEETGRLAAMLSEAADVLDRDVQTKLDRLSALLLPAVTIVLGLAVAAIMGGVVSGLLAANDMAL